MPVTVLEKSLYRNQFILGPIFIEEFTSWKKIRVNNSLYLTVHPDLNTSQAVYGDKSITLLGFVLDPDNPQASDSDIIDSLLCKLFSCDTFLKHTYKYGGRWILIVDDGKEIRLFHDAVGLRQVFYTDISQTKDVWCASQPGIIAKRLDLGMDKNAVDFINSYELRQKKEYWWPGDSSPYREIRHLLPNHYLNLKTGKCHRYWPDKPLSYQSFNDAIEKIAGTLKGLMKSASNRYDLALAITAGWDTRLVLAASKPISDKLSYETVIKLDMPEDHADIKVPSDLLSYLGLRHDVIKSSYLMDDEFIKLYKKNVILAHDVWAPDAQAILDYYNQRKVAVTGSASEIVRLLAYRLTNERYITPQWLSVNRNFGNNQFAINCFKNWISGLGELYNLSILDLFSWEQINGNWLAICQLEFDIAWKDIFTPYNCRNLLTNMLSVEEKYRRPPEYKLYSELMLKLWPEVLIVPINPHKKYKKKKFYSSLRTQLSRYTPYFIKRIKRELTG